MTTDTLAGAPEPGTSERYWWEQGRLAEAAFRDMRPRPLLEVREVLEAMSELYGPDWPADQLVSALARVYVPERLKRKHRKPLKRKRENGQRRAPAETRHRVREVRLQVG